MRMAVLDAGRRIATIDKLPWFVEQERTASHGYRIVPFDPEGAHDDRKPSLQAFHIDLERYGARFQVALVDGGGAIVAGSTRRIRVPNGSTSAGVLLLAAFLPLAVGIGVTLARWRITSA